MKTKEYIAIKIAEYRKANRLSQEQLGAMLRHPVKKATISSWENGRTEPDSESTLDLCEAFGVDISAFYPRKDGVVMCALAQDEQEVIGVFRGISPEGKKAIMTLIRGIEQKFGLNIDKD